MCVYARHSVFLIYRVRVLATGHTCLHLALAELLHHRPRKYLAKINLSLAFSLHRWLDLAQFSPTD